MSCYSSACSIIGGYNHYGLQFDDNQVIDANKQGHGILRIVDETTRTRTKIVTPE